MSAPIDFYFDFTSPYGYLAAHFIDDLGARHRRTVMWHPILLGAIFKTTGNSPLTAQPLKGPYAVRDFARSARFHKVPFSLPSRFPIAGVRAARAYLWAAERDVGAARTLAQALFKAYFVDDRDISEAPTVVDVAASLGHDPAAVAAALEDGRIKEALRAEVDAAAAAGVFGSPYVIVDGEPFWGMDRFPQIEAWLSTGGW
jgi:2-hydroxychromene-2-carboxylate isomerase